MIRGKYSQRPSIKKGAELVRPPPPPTCTSESSNFYPFKISHNLGRILKGDSPEERKKKLLFNYTDPFNSRRGSHIKTIQSPAILQQHIPESMFHAGCNIFCCSATPPGQISSIYVCVVGGGGGGKENNLALTKPLLFHYELESHICNQYTARWDL